MGVAFSAVFSNMLPEEKLDELVNRFHPILAVSLLAAIVDLGAPLDYHLTLIYHRQQCTLQMSIR